MHRPPAHGGVGSKSFTESYILGEIVADVIERTGEVRVDRRLGLGGTGITYRAVASGDIDLYPEYTGTISQAILEDPSATTLADIRAGSRVTASPSESPSASTTPTPWPCGGRWPSGSGCASISDLARHPELEAAFSSGFTDREDGWPGLRRHYGLELARVRVMEHALTYEALAAGEVDVIDIYSTDGKLERLDLAILEDDRRFFPDYQAVLLVRKDFIERYPRSWRALQTELEGRLDERSMSRLNALADLDGEASRRSWRRSSSGRPGREERHA